MSESAGIPLILVVEDSATQAAALSEFLERAGFRCIAAKNGEMALELLEANSVDLVLSDVVMPGMDGYDLAKRIRSMPAQSDLPIVLLTSLTDPLAIVRGLESGADHYVTKPYDPAGLLGRVRTVLGRRADARPHPQPIKIELLGVPFTIAATKEQILDLLVSSYSDLMRTSEAVRDAERRARFLAEATEILSSTLDVQQVLGDLARLVVPRISDLCTADLTENDNYTRRVHIAHRFGDTGETSNSEGSTSPSKLSEIASRAIANGAVEVVAVTGDEQLVELAPDPKLLFHLRKNGPFVLLVAPLIARRGPIGFLQFLSADLDRFSAPESLLFIEDLARRVALAVDNALLYREAQHATSARDDMLAIVSHDLRNPLNTIHMSTAFLLDILATPGDKTPIVPQLQLIRRATARGNALIQDLLDVSRIESGSLAVEASFTSAAGLLADAVAELEPLTSSKGLQFEHRWIGPDSDVPADRGRISQVFSNLVGNAAKFTPKSGTVSLTGTRRDNNVEFTVKDTGIGIAPDHLPHLFNRFWKASKGSRSGAGLGLFIVKGIVESHGGTLTVDSMLGEGTTFRFTLPGASDAPWRSHSADLLEASRNQA